MLLNLSLQRDRALLSGPRLTRTHATGAYSGSGHSLRCASHPPFFLHYTWLMQHHWKPRTSKNVKGIQKWVCFPPEREDCNNYGVTSAHIMGPLCSVQFPGLLVDLRLGKKRAGQGWGAERDHRWITGFVCRHILGFWSYGWNGRGSELLRFACSLGCTQRQTHVKARLILLWTLWIFSL